MAKTKMKSKSGRARAPAKPVQAPLKRQETKPVPKWLYPLGAVLLLALKRGSALAGARLPVDHEGRQARRQQWRKAWPWVLANGVAGPALGVSCYQWALKTTPTGIVLPIVAITPLVIIPFSYHLEGERPSRRSIAGGALAVAGAAALAWVKSGTG